MIRTLLMGTALSLLLTSSAFPQVVIGVAGNIANGQGGGGGGGNPPCPFSGGTAADGCSGAPAGYTDVSNILTYKNSTALSDGTIFQFASCTGTPRGSNTCAGVSNHLTWNIPGIDFAVGIVPGTTTCNGSTKPCSTTAGATGLIDASNATYWGGVNTRNSTSQGAIDTGCNFVTYTLSAAADGGGAVQCELTTSGHTVNLNGYDWSPNEGGGSEACVDLEVDTDGTSISGTINFTNNHWKNLNHQACNFPNAANGHGWISNFYIITSVAANITENINNNSFDGQGSQAFALSAAAAAGTGNGAATPTCTPTPCSVAGGGGNAIITAHGAGAITFDYNYVRNIPLRIIDTVGTCGGFTQNYNVFHNFGYYTGYHHWETGLFGVDEGICTTSTGVETTAHQTMINNLIYEDRGLVGNPSGDAPFTTGYTDTRTGGYLGVITLQDIEMNLIEMNPLGSIGIGSEGNFGTVTWASGSVSHIGDVLQMSGGPCTGAQPEWNVQVSTSFASTGSNGSSMRADPFAGGVCQLGGSATVPPNYTLYNTAYTVTCVSSYNTAGCGTYNSTTISIGSGTQWSSGGSAGQGVSISGGATAAGNRTCTGCPPPMNGITMVSGQSYTLLTNAIYRNNIIDDTNSFINQSLAAPSHALYMRTQDGLYCTNVPTYGTGAAANVDVSGTTLPSNPLYDGGSHNGC